MVRARRAALLRAVPALSPLSSSFALLFLVACAAAPSETPGGGPPSGAGGSSSGAGGSSSGGGGSGGSGPSNSGNGPWRRANRTHFESYPDPGSEECIKYNGCSWSGLFAFLQGKQSQAWVMANNIAAVHAKDADAYKLRTLRVRQGGRTIDAKVYDQCSDADCNGCCTRNARDTGFLIDLEKHTMDRFGGEDGVVEWMCLDCN
jgi:hypothetical protein